MFICNECGNTKELEEMYYDAEVREHSFECSCGGEYEEASTCPVCDNYFYSEELEICEDCFNAQAKDLVKDYGEENKTAVEINGYLAYEFTAEQIEAILSKELAQYKKNGGFTKEVEYCKDDGYFDSWVVVRNNGGRVNERIGSRMHFRRI